jgi:hypothetical protein
MNVRSCSVLPYLWHREGVESGPTVEDDELTPEVPGISPLSVRTEDDAHPAVDDFGGFRRRGWY